MKCFMNNKLKYNGRDRLLRVNLCRGQLKKINLFTSYLSVCLQGGISFFFRVRGDGAIAN